MQDDGSRGPMRPLGTGGRPRQRVRADLERRGVPEPFAEPLAERLAELASQLSASEYQAAVLATAAACEILQSDAAQLEVDSRARDVREIQHLMQGFAGELRKLEEGLSVLSAYLVRLRTTADGEPGGVIH
jgi:hypothetical protein